MRIPKPFFRKQTRTWYAQLGKKQHNLGPDEEAAKEKYHVLMAGRQPVTDVTTVVDILYQFLAWDKQHRAASTHEQYAFHINRFARFIGDSLPLARLTPDHITAWIDADYEGQSTN